MLTFHAEGKKSHFRFIVAKTYLAIAFEAAFDVDASAPRATWVFGALQTLILIFAPMLKNGFPIRPSTFFKMKCTKVNILLNVAYHTSLPDEVEKRKYAFLTSNRFYVK